MSIPYLPGIGDTLRQNLPVIGQAIQGFINPHAKQQQELERQLMDPTFAQNFADLYNKNPQAFDPKIYGARNLQTAAGIQQSPTGKLKDLVSNASITAMGDRNVAEAAGRSNVGAPTKSRETLDQQAIQANEFKLKQQTEFRNYLQSLPEDQRSSMLRIAAIRDATGLTPNEIEARDIELGQMKKQEGFSKIADQFLGDNAEYSKDPVKLAQDIYDGKVDIVTQAALLNHPQYSKGLSVALQKIRSDKDQEEALIRQANQINATGERADKRLLAAQQHDERMASRRSEEQYKNEELNFTTTLLKALNSKNLDFNEINSALVPALQLQFDRLYQVRGMGKAPKIEYSDNKYWFTGNSWKFVDPITGAKTTITPETLSGKLPPPIKDSTASDTTTSPNATSTGESREAFEKREMSDWKTATPADRARLKKSDPARYERLKKATGVE